MGVPGSTQGVTGSMPPAPSPSPSRAGDLASGRPPLPERGSPRGSSHRTAGAPPAQGPGAARRHQGLPVRRAFESAAATGGAGFGGGLGAAAEALPMIGDMSPIRTNATGVGPPPPPGSRGASLPYPSVRGFKVSENMSPRPQDRFFYNFNYYNNVNATINAYNQVPIEHLKAYRHLFGWEKTFNEGKGSIGLRLPLNTLTADPTMQGLSTPTRTAMGNLTVFAKYILEQNPRTGSLASVGLAVTVPTGPGDSPGRLTCSGSTPRPSSPSSATSTTSATCTSRASAHSISPPTTAT